MRLELCQCNGRCFQHVIPDEVRHNSNGCRVQAQSTVFFKCRASQGMAGAALHGAVGLRGRAAALAFCVSYGVQRGADRGLLRRFLKTDWFETV